MSTSTEQYKTYLWQEEYGQRFFRIQTNDPRVARKMNRRKTCKLVGYGINERLWIYVSRFNTPQKARNALMHLTGRIIQKDARSGVYYAETYPILTLNKEIEINEQDRQTKPSNRLIFI